MANMTMALPAYRKTIVLFNYEHTGFGYADHLYSDGYGHTLTDPAWVFRQIAKLGELRLVLFSEVAWAKRHDSLLVSVIPIDV